MDVIFQSHRGGFKMKNKEITEKDIRRELWKKTLEECKELVNKAEVNLKINKGIMKLAEKELKNEAN